MLISEFLQEWLSSDTMLKLPVIQHQTKHNDIADKSSWAVF